MQRPRQDRVISLLWLLLASPCPARLHSRSLAKVISSHSFAAVLKFQGSSRETDHCLVKFSLIAGVPHLK